MNHTQFPPSKTAVEGAGAFTMNNAAFTNNNNPTFAPLNSNVTNTAMANNNNNHNPMTQVRTKAAKRRPSYEGHGQQQHQQRSGIVTGRSFKRLRLDHVHISAAGGGPIISSAQSIGTLSVGTMGGDLESNDEDLGDEDDETLGPTTSNSLGACGGGGGGAGGCCGEESVASSWVASLGGNSSTNFRKRRVDCMDGGMMTTNSNVAYQSQFQSHPNSEDDDAATCSAMTTAAVAPRHRRRGTHLQRQGSNSGQQQKRRAIGFRMDSSGELKEEDELVIEDLEVPNSLLTNNDVNAAQHQRIMSQQPLMPMPPIGQIPDPLLVAAQHAAVGNTTAPLSAASSQSKGAGGNNNMGTVLLMNDCCSSVTEEETSLAEDEASISAISIGANTTVSALSGGMDGAPTPTPGMQGSFDQVDNRQRTMMMQHGQHPGAMKSNNLPPSGAMMKSNNGPIVAAYAPLNQILGGLHKERLTRLSMNRPLSRGESSLHSMGSEGAHSGGGNSYRSLPHNLHHANSNVRGVNTMAWNPHQHYQQQMQKPPPFVQQHQHNPSLSMMDEEDAEMEEADETATANSTAAIAPAGSFNSAVSHGSVAGNSFHGGHSHASNLSRAGSSVASGSGGGGEDQSRKADPKWKRSVNLPSHSSLY